jgi:hypothetical protein
VGAVPALFRLAALRVEGRTSLVQAISGKAEFIVTVVMLYHQTVRLRSAESEPM